MAIPHNPELNQLAAKTRHGIARHRPSGAHAKVVKSHRKAFVARNALFVTIDRCFRTAMAMP